MDKRNKEILKIALPSIISNITVPLLGLVDVTIVGHLGAAAYIGAIAVGGMMFNVTYWIFGFLRMGTSGMTSQALGRRDFREVTRLLARSLGIAFAVAAALILLQKPLLAAALAIMQPTEEVARLTAIYFNTLIYGAPAMLGLFSLSGWFIGMQHAELPVANGRSHSAERCQHLRKHFPCVRMRNEGRGSGLRHAHRTVCRLHNGRSPVLEALPPPARILLLAGRMAAR